MSWSSISQMDDEESLLLDLYVPGAGLNGWRAFVDFVRTGHFPFDVSRGNESVDLPSHVEAFFVGPDEPMWMLRLHVGHIDVHCYFFTEDEIELDLLSRDVTTDAEAEVLFALMLKIADAVGRECRLTNENDIEHPLALALPGGRLILS
jgi:hypothetical protein